jgi:hypothetical protein
MLLMILPVGVFMPIAIIETCPDACARLAPVFGFAGAACKEPGEDPLPLLPPPPPPEEAISLFFDETDAKKFNGFTVPANPNPPPSFLIS